LRAVAEVLQRIDGIRRLNHPTLNELKSAFVADPLDYFGHALGDLAAVYARLGALFDTGSLAELAESRSSLSRSTLRLAAEVGAEYEFLLEWNLRLSRAFTTPEFFRLQDSLTKLLARMIAAFRQFRAYCESTVRRADRSRQTSTPFQVNIVPDFSEVDFESINSEISILAKRL
jgi:hypothetical protein